MEEDSYAATVEKEALSIIPKISGILSFLVVFIMLVLTIIDKKLVDRVSLRLQTAISALDVWFHTMALWVEFYSYGQNPMCTFIGWQVIFGFLLYSFLNVAVGVNLQLVFLHDVVITRWIEAAYWVGPVILGLVISIPPLILGKFGHGDLGCFINTDGGADARVVDALTLEIWILLSMIYLLIIVILVFNALGKQKAKLKRHGLSGDRANSMKAIRSVQILGYRILLYPIVMILTQVGNVISNLYFDINNELNDSLDKWGTFSFRLSGTLNFIAFCCDPTLHSALKKVYSRIVAKFNQINKKEEIPSTFELIQPDKEDITDGDIQHEQALSESQAKALDNLISSL